MQISLNSAVDWTRKIKSDSMMRNVLGIWGHHLRVQEEFTAGITTGTSRARYYTIWAYFFQHLDGVIDPRDFERIFILSSLAHHDGDSNDPRLLSLINKRKFVHTWEQIDPFTLGFDINGQGWTYYIRQLMVFRCAWADEFGLERVSHINEKLADTLSFLDPQSFTLKSLSKKQLTTLFDGFCICCISENQDEIDILSKLIFGFFYENNGTAGIDEAQFSAFMNGGSLDLNFADRSAQNLGGYSSLKEESARRRNTIFLFLQIIDETSPYVREFVRFMWDAIYFGQNRGTFENIEFGKLEKARQYWESFQLNVYYVFLLEKMLEEINHIIIKNIGVNKRNLLATQNIPAILTHLSHRLKCPVDEKTSMAALVDVIRYVNQNSKSTLESELNESEVYDNLINAEDTEFFFSECLILLGLLQIRYFENLQPAGQHRSRSSFSSLNIEDLFAHLAGDGGATTLIHFLSDLAQMIVNRHLFISAGRLANGTRNWIFTEEDERLYSAREDFEASPRDNRWPSIKSILSDLEFIFQNGDEVIELTDKGAEWLRKMQSI